MVRTALDVCPHSRKDGLHLHKPYISSITNVNKAVQFVLFMFSFVLSWYFKSSVVVYEELVYIHSIPLSKLDLHIYVMGFSLLFGVLIVVAYASNAVIMLSDRIQFTWEIMAGLHVLGSLVILVVTSITLNNILYFRHHICDTRPVLSCPTYDGAGATSFFAVVSMAFDAGLHILKARRSYKEYKERQFAARSDGKYKDTEEGNVNPSYESQTEAATIT